MTIQPEQTVREIVAQSSEVVGILEDHGIDYCCGGNRSLAAACRERGIDWASIAKQIEAAGTVNTANQPDWSAASLVELIRHIVSVHHAYLHQELPRLADRLERVQKAHAKDAAILTPLGELCRVLREELDGHLLKEERVLFPFIEQMEKAMEEHRPGPALPFGAFGNPIRTMEHEHDDAGHALAEIRRLTGNFALPAHACNTYRALYSGLQKLERDLHQHIHLENNVLFPRALALEARQMRN